MLRKILPAVVVVIALIILFFLVKTAVNAFRDDPKPTAPVQTEATVTDPAENPASEAGGTAPSQSPQSLPATNDGGISSQPLPNSGPAETATAIVAVTVALGTVLVVRRRQLASL